MVEVRWTPLALEDIDNIAEYIAKDSEKFALIQTERFFERALILINQPNAGRIVPEANDKTLRELISGNYRIIYRVISKSRIDILTVHHSAKQLPVITAFEDI